MEDLFRARNRLLDGDRVRDGALHHPELRVARKQGRGLPLAAGEVVEPDHLVASPQQFLRDMTADEPRCARDADLRHPLSPPRPGTDHGLVEAGLKSVNDTPHPPFPSAVASFVQSQAFVSIWC